jgi:hypothetical protein
MARKIVEDCKGLFNSNPFVTISSKRKCGLILIEGIYGQ